MDYITPVAQNHDMNMTFSKGQQRRAKHSGGPKAAVTLLLLYDSIFLD